MIKKIETTVWLDAQTRKVKYYDTRITCEYMAQEDGVFDFKELDLEDLKAKLSMGFMNTVRKIQRDELFDLATDEEIEHVIKEVAVDY